LLSGTVAWGSTAYPSSWVFAAFPLLLIGLHGAERALLRRAAAPADGSPGEGASAAPIR
jgi:hypothetical protein